MPMARAATPIPMPAFAPVERPEEEKGMLVELGVELEVELEVEVAGEDEVVKAATFQPSMATALMAVAEVTDSVVDIHEKFAA